MNLTNAGGELRSIPPLAMLNPWHRLNKCVQLQFELHVMCSVNFFPLSLDSSVANDNACLHRLNLPFIAKHFYMQSFHRSPFQVDTGIHKHVTQSSVLARIGMKPFESHNRILHKKM